MSRALTTQGVGWRCITASLRRWTRRTQAARQLGIPWGLAPRLASACASIRSSKYIATLKKDRKKNHTHTKKPKPKQLPTSPVNHQLLWKMPDRQPGSPTFSHCLHNSFHRAAQTLPFHLSWNLHGFWAGAKRGRSTPCGIVQLSPGADQPGSPCSRVHPSWRLALDATWAHFISGKHPTALSDSPRVLAGLVGMLFFWHR